MPSVPPGNRGLPAPGEVLGGLRLERLLGRGGMGAVYLGVQGELRRAVKVAILGGPDAPEMRARFEREAQALARIPPHPGVLRVHSAGVDGERGYCVLELVEGEGLDRIVARGPLPVERALELAEQLARALAHVHARGILHRDVKPANVLVRAEDGSAVLADFGLALDLEEHERLTQSGYALGTPVYMSPEQATSRRDVDARSDVYSLGAVLYALLAGRPPFAEGGLVQVMKSVVSGEADPLPSLRPDVPGAVQDLVARAMAKDREARFASAGELARALAAVRRGEGLERGARRRRLAVLGVAAVAAPALLLLALLLRARERERATARAWAEGVASARARVAEASRRPARRALLGLPLAALDVAALDSATGELAQAIARRPERGPEDLLALAPALERETRRRLVPVAVGRALEVGDAAGAARALDDPAADPAEREVLAALVDLPRGRAQPEPAPRARPRSLAERLARMRADLVAARTDAVVASWDDARREAKGDPDGEEAVGSLRPQVARLLATDAAATSNARALAALLDLVGDVERARLADLARRLGRAAAAGPDERACTLVLERIAAVSPGAFACSEVADLYARTVESELRARHLREAARAFERVRLADPARDVPFELRARLEKGRREASVARDTEAWVRNAVDTLRAGCAGEPNLAGWSADDRQRLLRDLEALDRTGGWAERLELAWVRRELGSGDTAELERLVAAVVADPQVPEGSRAQVHYLHALVLDDLGRTDDAIAAARAARAAFYERPDAAQRVVAHALLAVRERRPEAIAAAREALQLADDRLGRSEERRLAADRPAARPLFPMTQDEAQNMREVLVDALVANARWTEAEAVIDELSHWEERMVDQPDPILEFGRRLPESLRLRAKAHFAQGLADGEKLLLGYLEVRRTDADRVVQTLEAFFGRIENETGARAVAAWRKKYLAPR